MEQLLFEDYIGSNLGHQKDASIIRTWVLKQVSRGRFEIDNNLCKVKILLNGEKEQLLFRIQLKQMSFEIWCILLHLRNHRWISYTKK